MRWLAVLLLCGCSHVRLDTAITAHNVFRQVVSDASDGYVALYGAAANNAMSKGEADYDAAMKPYNAVVTALHVAKEAENVLHNVLDHCIAENDAKCDGSRIGFACAAAALDSLSNSYGQIRGGAPLYAATAVAKAQLLDLADGASCK
jgi:ribosomal protein L18